MEPKPAYKPKPGEKWVVAEVHDVAGKVKFESLPEGLLESRQEELNGIYEKSRAAWLENGKEGKSPEKPRVKIYRKDLTKEQSLELEFERNQRMRKQEKQ